MAHIHGVYDTDGHFIVDPDTRVMKNVSESKITIMQYDHNSERITFELPRYVDEHDMSECNIVEIHYTNKGATEQNEGVYTVDDLQVSPEDENTVICSWLVSQNATKLAGPLHFLIRFACTTNSEIDYAWSTAPYAGLSVTRGIYNTNTVVEQHVDVLELWRRLLFGSGETDGETSEAVRSYVTVAKRGGQFSSISEAVEYAKTICSQTSRVLVLVLDNAIYDEEITLLANPGVDIAGFGAVIRHDSVYPHAPLYTTGRGTFAGLIFENYNTNTGTKPSYAMHFDYNNEGAQASGETRFVDCRFVAANSYGAGIGMGPDIDLIFDGCFFRSTTHSGMYLHNSPFAAQNQIVRCNNCNFVGLETDNGSAVVFDDAVDASSGAISPMSVYLNNCSYLPMAPIVKSKSGGVESSTRALTNTTNLAFNTQGCLLPHFTPLNLGDPNGNSYTLVTGTNQNGHATVFKPSPMPAQTTITILSCAVNDGTTITPEVIADAGQAVAIISTGKPNAVLQLAVRLLPSGVT